MNSSRRSFRSLRVLLALGCSLPFAGAGAAVAATTPRAVQAHGGEPVVLLISAHGTEVEDAGGRVPVALGAGEELETVEAIAGGWVAAGRRRASDSTDLLLLVSHGRTVAPLPDLPPRAGPHRGSPVLLVERGHLAGIAWLEGSSPFDFSVRAASWDGRRWGAVEIVSPATGREQLALAGSVLDDGSWLLAWAAVDGEDDEIMWSRRRATTWSAPARLHEDNHAPDITPTVVAVPGGAVAAWSWLDGRDYRVRTARFDGGRWQIDAPFGYKGGVAPGLVRQGQRAALLYFTVLPETWSVLELDAEGRHGRHVELFDPPPGRPIVELGGSAGDEVLLSWPGAAASDAAIEAHLPLEPGT